MLRQWILTASVLTGAALLLRLLFHRRISQRLQYALWLPVLLRLLLPFSLYSAPVSVPAAAERVVPAVFVTAAPRSEPVLPAVSAAPRPPAVSAAPLAPAEITQPRPAVTPPPAVPAERTLDWLRILRFVWLDGSLVLALWLLGVNLGFSNRLRKSRTLFREGKTPVYVSEAVASPCLFGLLRPAVYLTPGAAELGSEQLEQVLLHERTHLRQGDPVWGLLRCLCLAVWWWNPLVWLAAACSRRDGELSCDEKVLRTLGEEKRLDYGHTLVDLLPKKTPGALLCTATISGGGKAMKERLERIVKKPRVWVIAAILAVLLTAFIVGCSFGGKGEGDPSGPSPSASPEPTAAAEPAEAWQEQYKELLNKALEDETLYEGWGFGPVQGFELLDLSGNGTPELVLYLPGAGMSNAAAVVTVEEGELRCLNRETSLDLPIGKNAVERTFCANPSMYDSEGEEQGAFFRYYYTADEEGRITDGFYLLNSENGVEGERWSDWILFGRDEQGNLLCETRLSRELHVDPFTEGFPEIYWEIDGEECTAEDYHAAVDAFEAWLGQYRCLPMTWESSCVIFRNEADPLAAVDRALAGWTPLPAAVPASMAFFTPVTEAMGRDWLTLPEGAVWLTEEELKEWEDWFAADWMRGQFLTSAYERPKDVDLHELFYIGVDTEEEPGAEYFEKNLNPITPEDKRAYLLHLGDWMTECPTDKLPRAQMETVLQKYLGLSLEETKRVRLSFSYLPETDAYYHSHGDTNYRGTPRLLYGYVRGDEIALFFPGEAMDFSPEYRLGYDTKYGVYRVVLRREGEEIRFRSNLLALTNGAEAYYDPPRIGSSVPANETGDYGRDVARFQRQYMAEAPEAADTWEYPGYGTLKYAEEEESVCLWFETVDGERWLLPTPQTAAGKLPMVRTGDGYTEGKGFVLVSGEDRDLITWSMQCPEQTILAGNTVRQGGFARWTVYLPTMETFVYFSPYEDRQDDTEQPGSLEWLELYLGGEEISATIREPYGMEPEPERKTVMLNGASCRRLLSECTWLPYDGPATDHDGEYDLVLQGTNAELLLTQGWPVALLRPEGADDNQKQAFWAYAPMDYPGSYNSPADMLRWQVFDQAEYREALEAIRIGAGEENTGEAFARELCEAEMKLFPGSTYGIRDSRILRVKQLPISGAEDTELAVGLEYALVPNEWNCVRWWSGSGCREGEGEYEGWLIEQRYDRLVLEDGAWRWAEGATGGGWANEIIMEMLEPAPEPTTEPTPEPTPAPTPEPAAYEPVTLEMWTDWLTLPEGARWLTQEELDAWTAWFSADRMRWSFLTSAYARPQDVDLGALFYTGVDLRESAVPDASHNPVTQEDMRVYLLHRGELEHPIDMDKLPREEMDALLRKYLGLGLEETNKVGLWFPYFPETDAYYHLHGDTNWGPFPLRYGYVLGDEVCLFNLSTGNHSQFSATGYNNGGEGIYRAVLRREGDSVHFVSNLRALTNGAEAAYDVPWQNDAYPDGYTEERDVTVITLIPEVYESAEAAREYVESRAFIVGDGNGGEAERYPIEILLEQDCPGYGTLIYGEIPTGTIHGSNPYLWFISTGGRLYRLPMPMGMANIRMERDRMYSADEGRGIRLQDSRSDMIRWWIRLTQEINHETNLYMPADYWTGGENKVVSSGTATWTLYLPTMEVFLLYEPEG